MHFGVVSFPGSNCEQDSVHAIRYLGYEASYIWHQDRDLSAYDAILLPGGFSYGDYLRCGAVARFSPVMEEIIRAANEGKPVIGICNGFQILTEAHLLPGALIRNKGLKFLCKTVAVRLEKTICKWTSAESGTLYHLPIAHNEGNYICDSDTLKRLQDGGQIVLRYCEESGEVLKNSADNGSLDNIAGICNEGGNVLGMMPHPERVCDGISNNSEGVDFFNGIVGYLERRA